MKKVLQFFFVFALIASQTATVYASGILKYGMQNEEVWQLQYNLNKLGYFTTKPTGYFGIVTLNAVKNFQKANKLTPDGIVGPKTQSTIISLLNKMSNNAARRVSSISSRGSNYNRKNTVQTPSTSSTKTTTKAPPAPSSQSTTKIGSGIVIVNNLNVRTGPGLNYKIIGSLNSSSQIDILEQSNDIWYKIKFGNNIGYVYAQYVIFKTATSNSIPTENILAGKTIFIDPGHGGIDPGTVNAGYQEKSFNLATATKLVALLRRAGANVIMTRDSDETAGLFDRPAQVNSYVLGLEETKTQTDIEQITKEINDKSNQLNTLNQQLQIVQSNITNENATYQKDSELLNDYIAQLPSDDELTDEQKQKINELKSNISNDLSTLNNLNSEKEKLTNEINDLTVKINTLTSQQNDYTSKLNKIKEIINEFTQIKGCDTRTGIFQRANEEMNPDLKWAFDIIKNYQDNIIFVSIHGNSTGDGVPRYSGTEVYYETDNTPTKYPGYVGYDEAKRKTLAWDILQGISDMSSINSRFIAEKDLAVLRESNVVSCLVEAGYLNNPQDRTILMQPANQEKIAEGIFSGIIRYFNN